MKILRSMAIYVMAIGLLFSATSLVQAQQGTGQRGNGTGSGGGGSQSQGGSSGASQSGMGQSGMGQSGMGGQQSSGGIPSSQMPQPTMSGLGLGADDAATNPRNEETIEKMRNLERQKKLLADTEKLLALATELKVDMDKTNKDMLSLDVIRKADEIEKLAHSVKEKMKGS